MTTITSSPMCRTTMQAYTRPLMWSCLLLALSVAIILGHQVWITSELKANINAGGLGDPDNVFPRIRLFAYLLEGLLFLVASGKLIEAGAKLLSAVQRRKKSAPRKSILMPGRCS